jgi:hypothetical protein
MPKKASTKASPATAPTKRALSEDHKRALAQGRQEGRIVRDYLEALRANKPRRGHRRTAESVNTRLSTIEQELSDAAPIDQLRLLQERYDLLAALGAVMDDVDIALLEAAFIHVAASYGERQGIAYASWREVGVPAEVLKRANISRSA